MVSIFYYFESTSTSCFFLRITIAAKPAAPATNTTATIPAPPVNGSGNGLLFTISLLCAAGVVEALTYVTLAAVVAVGNWKPSGAITSTAK